LILKGRIQFYPFLIEPTYLPIRKQPFGGDLKPRLRVRSDAEALARGQLAELHFWKLIKEFPYQSNSQNFLKFYCHFSLVDAKKVFSRSALLASRETVLKFCPLAEKRGSLEGVRERGFKYPELNLDRYVYWYRTNINLIDFYSYRKKNL
jgi:hypothetical protein